MGSCETPVPGGGGRVKRYPRSRLCSSGQSVCLDGDVETLEADHRLLRMAYGGALDEIGELKVKLGRLHGLVEAAYLEGHREASHVSLWDHEREAWMHSEHAKALDGEEEGARDTSVREMGFLADAAGLASRMEERFGPHSSASFAMCRITEEVGELAQAATAMSKGRGINRAPRIRDEALDSVAMILRLLREFPDGRNAAAEGSDD